MLLNSDDNNNNRLFGNDAPNDDSVDSTSSTSSEPKLFTSSHSSSQNIDEDELDKEFESFAISFKANDPTASTVSEKLKSELNDQKMPAVDEFSDDFDDFNDFKIDSNISAFKPLDKLPVDDTPSKTTAVDASSTTSTTPVSDFNLDFPDTSSIDTNMSDTIPKKKNSLDDEFDSFVPDTTINPFKAAPVFPKISGKVNSASQTTSKAATPVSKPEVDDAKVAAREKAKANLDFPVDEFKLPEEDKKIDTPNEPKDDFKPESFGKVSSGANAFSKKSPFAKSEFNSEDKPIAMTERKASDKPAEKVEEKPSEIEVNKEEVVAAISAVDDPASISPFKKIETPKEPVTKVETPDVPKEEATPKSDSNPGEASNKPLARPAISKPVTNESPVKSRPGAVENSNVSKTPTKSKTPDIAPVTPVKNTKKEKKPSKEQKDPGIKGIIILIVLLAIVLLALLAFENWNKISSVLGISGVNSTKVAQVDETTKATTEAATEATTTAEATTKATTTATTTKATTTATTTEATTEATTAATTTEATTTEATTEATTTATTTEATTEATTTATTTEATTEATTTATTTEATTTTTTTEATTTTTTTEATTVATTTTRVTSTGSSPVFTFYQGIKNAATTDDGFVFDLKLENYGSVDAVLSDSLNSVKVTLSCNSKITNVTSDYFTFTQSSDNTWVGTPKSNVNIPAGETFLGTVNVTTESSVNTFGISSYYFDWNK